MSAEVNEQPTEQATGSQQLAVITAELAKFDKVAAGLAELERQYKGILYEVRTSRGMEAAKAARAAIRKPRYDIENMRKALKAPVLELGRKIDSKAAAITRELEALEDPIHAMITAEEKRIAEEKERAIAAEQKRVADIQARILMIRNVPASAATAPPAVVRDYIDKLEQLPLDEGYGEFQQQAADAKAASLGSLYQLYAAAVERAAEDERIRTERAELDRLRKEKDERDRIEAKRKAQEDAEAKAAAEQREQEVAAIMASMKAEREANERSAAARQAELDLQADQLATQLAELKRQQDALPAPVPTEEAGLMATHMVDAVIEEKPRIRVEPPARPSTIDIIEVIVKHFGVKHTVAMEWLKEVAEEFAE